MQPYFQAAVEIKSLYSPWDMGASSPPIQGRTQHPALQCLSPSFPFAIRRLNPTFLPRGCRLETGASLSKDAVRKNEDRHTTVAIPHLNYLETSRLLRSSLLHLLLESRFGRKINLFPRMAILEGFLRECSKEKYCKIVPSVESTTPGLPEDREGLRCILLLFP